MRTILFLILLGSGLCACSGDETESPLYQQGYEAGLFDGQKLVCKRIGEFNYDMKYRLMTEGIC